VESIATQFSGAASTAALQQIRREIASQSQANAARLQQQQKQAQIEQLAGQVKHLEQNLSTAKKTGRSQEDIAALERLLDEAKAELAKAKGS